MSVLENRSTSRTFAELPLVQMPAATLMLARDVAPWLAQMALEHGPVFRGRVQMGPQAGMEFAYLVGAEANQLVMYTQRDAFSHDLGWSPIIGEMMGHGLLNMDPPEWTRHRKLWNPAFSSAYMATYLPVMHRVVAERTGDWPARAEVDVYHEAREITFDIAAAALAGLETGAEVDHLRELFYTLLHGYDPQHDTLDSFFARRVSAQRELSAMLLGMIAARRARPAQDKPRDVLDMIVHARDEEGTGLSDEQVLAHVNILLVAGHETTTSLVSWLFYLLATHPDYLARVRAELDALPGGADTPVSDGDLKRLPALNNAIRETGRLRSPVVTVPRGLVRDVEFAGCTLPAGTQVRLAIGATHRLPDLFRDPEAFDPDRFAPPRDEDAAHPYALATFGGGQRTCIGIHFAQIEAKVVAARVLRGFDLEPLPGQDIAQVGFITTGPVAGIRMRVRPRAH